jgi:hypothetical protein
VAAAIEADKPETLGERLNLRVPHVQRRPERIRQHEDRRAFGSFDFHVDRATVCIDDRHKSPSC